MSAPTRPRTIASVVEPSSAPWSGLHSVMVRPASPSCRAKTAGQRIASSKVRPALCSGAGRVGVAEQQQLVVTEQRPSRPELGQLGGGPWLVEQVRDAHGVEDAGTVGGRGEQIHPAVHVEQRRLDAPVQDCGHDRNGDAAFAAQHQRDPSVGQDLGHTPAGLVEHAEHGLEVVEPSLVRVWPPPHHGQVTVVRDAHAGCGQPLGQSGSAQRGRRLLLTSSPSP